MFDVLSGTAAVMGWIISWSLVFSGIGALFQRLVWNRQDRRLSFDRFWTGLALAICFLQLWHLFWPIDWKASAFVSAFGIAGQFSTWRESIAKIKAARQHVWLLASAVIFCAWAANLALRMPWNYDSGLYHFQSVRWANEYAIVPGLGNLHPRLAFNQSYFLFVALLNVTPFFQKAHVVGNSLLLAVLGWQLLLAAFPRTSPTHLRVFSILMLAFVAKQATRESLSSPSPDFPIYILGTVLMVWLIEVVVALSKRESLGPWSMLATITLSCTALTFKLSSLGVALAVTGVVTWVHWRGERLPFFRNHSVALITAALLLGVWAGRGVISSGYPLFPATIAPVKVDWRIPFSVAQAVQHVVYSWGRNPAEEPATVLKDSAWIKKWLKKNLKSSKLNRPLLLFVVSLAALWYLPYRFPATSQLSLLFFAPFLPPICWTVYWFLTAPDPRFGLGALNLLGAWSATLLLVELFAIWRSRQAALIWAAILLAALLGLPRVVKNGKFIAGFGSSRFGELPTASLLQITLASGLSIYVPAKHGLPCDAGITWDGIVWNAQAWNAPLPSAPCANEHLELRRGRIQNGFRDRRKD